MDATNQPNKSQQRVLDYIVETFGGTPSEVKMIGRKLWFHLENPKRHWVLGDTVFGTIGPRGGFDLKLPMLGTTVRITDMLGVSVYLKPLDECPACVASAALAENAKSELQKMDAY